MIERPDSAAILGELLTSLEADETTVGIQLPSLPPVSATDAHSLCECFRHSGWQERRSLTLSALRDADASPSSLERFARCGDRAWLLQCVETPEKIRLAANRCRCRWCIPCATEKRRTLQSNVRAACVDKILRFVTFTLKSIDQPLSEQLARLRSSFRKIRQLREFRGCFTGGVYFIEMTCSGQTNLWHPHLHVLVEGRYIPQKQLADAWLAVTGDSYIVDIRRIPNSGIAAGYIAKYAGKPLPASIVHNHARFVEAIEAFHGSRTFHVFGDWSKLDLSKPPADGGTWVPLMPLASCILAARSGDARCRDLLSVLRRENAHEPLDADAPDSS